jgi:Tol biopolymer transport system component
LAETGGTLTVIIERTVFKHKTDLRTEEDRQMQWRYSLAHLTLAVVLALSLAPLMIVVDAQAQIAFMSHRDGNPEIYVMNPDGQNQRRLTNNPASDHSPLWSFDGKRIAFVSGRNWILGYDIYVMDANGRNQRRLTNNRHKDFQPSWSPDGKRIAFISDRDGHVHEGWSTDEIYVMDADGSNQQRLTNHPNNDYSPSWSSDSKRIAFVSHRDGNGEIYMIDADGGNLQNLTNNPRSDVSPAWLNSPFSVSPAGKKFTMWGWLKQVDR